MLFLCFVRDHLYYTVSLAVNMGSLKSSPCMFAGSNSGVGFLWDMDVNVRTMCSLTAKQVYSPHISMGIRHFSSIDLPLSMS